MKSCRLVAAVLYVCGLMCVLLGWEGMTRAQSCDAELYESAHCISAHTGGPVPSASHAYCHWENNVCVQAPNSRCFDRWGVAYSGKCEWDPIGTTELYNCFKDAFATLVYLHWYEAHCRQHNAECNCEWEQTTTIQTVQLCDCYDEAVDDDL